MFGGRWVEEPGDVWKLVWTEAVKDFYLNNILIHELGHLLDDRNSRSSIASGTPSGLRWNTATSRLAALGAAKKPVTRRHH